MYKILRSSLSTSASNLLKLSLRLPKVYAPKAFDIKITKEVTDNLPVPSKQETSDIVDYFEDKWTNQREKVLRYPEHLKEIEVQQVVHKIIKLPSNEFKELIESP